MPLTSSIYLLFLPLEMQGRLKQTKVYHTFFYFLLKETIHKPLKVVAGKTHFSSVYVIGTIYFDECYLFYVTTGRRYFTFYSEIALSAMLLLSLKPVS